MNLDQIIIRLEPGEHWYRVEETAYSAGVNEWGDPLPGGPTRTNLRAYLVIKRTPTGAWIEADHGKRFVSLNWRKRFALPTVEEAIESYKARKRRQLTILKAQIERVNEALAYLDVKGFYSDARKWMR